MPILKMDRRIVKLEVWLPEHDKRNIVFSAEDFSNLADVPLAAAIDTQSSRINANSQF
jgi:hypothetical protein